MQCCICCPQRPDGTYIRPMIQDNGDGTYTVQYTPEDCGPYTISVTFGGEPVKNAPFKTTAIPTGDASKCRITGEHAPKFFAKNIAFVSQIQNYR